MKKTSKFTRGLCLLISLVMILGYLPAPHVHAASNVDGGLEGQAADVFTALGFDTSVEPEGYDADTVDNPFGRTKSPGTQIWEALVSSSKNGIVAAGSGNGKTNNNLGASGVVNAAASGSVPLKMFATAAADFDNDGLAGEAVYVGYKYIPVYDSQYSTLGLYVYDAKTGTFSNELDLGLIPNGNYQIKNVSNDTEYTLPMYAAQNMLQVTAGDYDGDGTAEIAVYVATEGNTRVDVYKWMKDQNSPADGWMNMSNWNVVWSYVLSNKYIPNMVSLHSADINKDGMDDLSISYGEATNTVESGTKGKYATSSATKSSAVILWGDRGKMLQKKYNLNLNAAGLGDLIRVSITTGDLNGDGYNEIVVTGQPLSDLEQNTSRSIIVYNYDGTGGLSMVQAETYKIVDGTYNQGSWISNNGFDEKYLSRPTMKTNAAVFKAPGYDNCMLYLDSCLYEYVEGKLILKMCLDDSTYDGTNSLNNPWIAGENYAEFSAASMDINGEGYHKLFASYYTTDSRYSATTYALSVDDLTYKVDSGFCGLEGVDGTLQAYGKHTSYYNYEASIPYQDSPPSPETMGCYYITAVNCDKDTTIMEYTGNHWLTYQDPQVLAVIAAAPYFEDVDIISDYDYAWQNTTTWSKLEGSGHGDSVQVDFEFGAFASVGTKFSDAEVALLFTLEWAKETSKTTEYTLTFETSQDEDAVAFFSVPVEHYEYRISEPNANGDYVTRTETVSRAFDLVYQVLPLDYYESLRTGYQKSLPAIRGKVLTSTPGDPSSYPSSTAGYDVITKWKDDPAGVSFGNGAITQEISITYEESESYNLGAALDVQAGGGYKSDIVEAIAGVTFSLNPSGGWVDYQIEGTTISGTITNMPLEFQDYGYYYDWSLFSYAAQIGKSTVPVVSYIVNNIAEPPKLPGDFQQDVERTTADKNVLTWTYDDAYSSFILYRYFDFPVGGGLQEIARFGLGETPYTLKVDETGKTYYEFYYEDTNLAPYSEYQYAIQVERLAETPPLSAPSGLLTARTKAADGNPILTINESDGTNDGLAQVYPDKNCYLIAQVNGPDGEQGSAYYTTIQYQWQKKNDQGKWEDLINETNQTLTIASAGSSTAGEYRCQVNVITNTDNTAISTYTDGVKLVHSKRTSLIQDAYVLDMAGKVKLYANVVNTHTDSATVPDGYVTFTFVNTATNATYPVNVTLDSSGVASVVSSNSLPDGQYRVYVSYSGSYIFKSCDKEIYYLSGQGSSYAIEALTSITYGEGTEVNFNKLTQNSGVTVANAEDAKFMVLAGDTTETILRSSGWVTTPVGTTLSVPSGYVLVQPGDPVAKGQNYLVKFLSNRTAEGGDTRYDWYIKFAPDFSGIVEKADWSNSNARIFVRRDTGYLTHTGTGSYTIQENAPAGTYTLAAASTTNATASRQITILPRAITLQLPDLVKKQDTNARMGDITYKNLSVVSGSWASCDTDEDGNVTGTPASTSVTPSYTNTAGSVFNKDSTLDTCGYYAIDAVDNLDNYTVTYRTGSLSVIGGNQPVTFGARPFEGQSVGTLYMVSPDYAYTREEKGITMAQAVGSRVVFTAAPDDGYQVYDWYVDGVPQGITTNRFSFVMLNQSSTVEVQFVFKPDTLIYGISGDQEGGTLACSDKNLTSGSIVIPNTYAVFTAQAKEGYHFKEWRYTELGKGTAYYTEDEGKMSSTFELLMPKISCSLYAVFERDGYTLTYTDKAGLDGLTAWYWGIPSGDTTAEVEQITIASGDSVPGGTEIVIEPRSGYGFDADYNFVSIGSQGVARYNPASYTLTINEDTEVTGYTYQKTCTLNLSAKFTEHFYGASGTKVTIAFNGEEHTFDYPDLFLETHRFLIPGGSDITVSATYPSFYNFDGWDVNGELRQTESFEISEIDGTTSLILRLTEKPTYDVTLADISGKGTYSVTLPDGARQNSNSVTCHENDPLTIQVIPASGYTVTYWNVVAANGEGWETKASSLKYQFPQLTSNYTFTPIFSGTTYHTVTWSTLPYYDVTLTPQDGCLSTVPSGSAFSFTLSGGEENYEYVLVNGRKFHNAENMGGHYPFRYEDVKGVRIYTISNITANQEISLSLEEPDYGITVTPASVEVPAGKTVTFTAEPYGTNLDLFTWSALNAQVFQFDTLQQGPSKTFVYQASQFPGDIEILTVQAGNSDNGTITTIASTSVTITVVDAAKEITITPKDLTVQNDGSVLVHPITPTGSTGKYDFDAQVKMYSGSTNSNVTWSVWGAQMRSTTINSNGLLTVSPKEYGTNGQLKVIATYTYPNGDTDQRELVVNLSPDAYLATEIVGTAHGTIDPAGYVSGGTVTITATPSENHAVAKWYIDGMAVSDNTSNTLTLVDVEEMSRHTIGVEFTHYYPELKYDYTNHWYACTCGGKTEIDAHYDFDKNHFCDACAYTMSTCDDSNKDHFCNWCGEKLDDCHDTVKDHICDWCSETLSECTDEDTNHVCDWCSKTLSQCEDSNSNHFCDYCKKVLSSCEDGNRDHNCDTCGRTLTECGDSNKDHNCDICGAELSQCEDKDDDHNCDSCGKPVTECDDSNNDHFCDLCGKTLSNCVDRNNDHGCDICFDPLSECSDDDNDHHCDICKMKLSQCADENDDHNCDVCGEPTSECGDSDNDHHCDICGTEVSTCTDRNNDHSCDVCGATLSECDDPKEHHSCTICGAELSVCADDDNNHNCDVCDKTLTECADDDSDHNCDTCGVELSTCADNDSNHNCDVCGTELSQCIDEDSNHYCDICGKRMTACEDEDENNICDVCEEELFEHECDDVSNDHKCDLCGQDLTECADTNGDHNCDTCHAELTECADSNNDHFCDICGVAMSQCTDPDKDHLCNICGNPIDDCADVDHDHNCDVCGAELGNCADGNDDHNCDVCNTELSKCKDEDSNHFCDICKVELSTCKDDNNNHECDICKESISDCVDENTNHHCDICDVELSKCKDEDSNHFCDICKIELSTCKDDNNDHECDICQAVLSTCEDKANEETGLYDHKCDICGNATSACADDDRNHTCELCGETISTCLDENHNHYCDICDNLYSQCIDQADAETGFADHICDICGETLTECADGNGDHKCDICGKVLTQCVDEDPADQICDICGEDMHTCEDHDKDHNCDFCGYKLTDCLDEEADEEGNTDHVCDICGETHSVCNDGNDDHKCDICGDTITECTDDNGDHKCDTCDKTISQCIDADHNDVCDICGKETYLHTDSDRDHRCDVCRLSMSECDDSNNDHLCDYCNLVWTACMDQNTNHKCDVCGADMGNHAPAEGSHICDYCGKTASDCFDGDKDHNCDICGDTISECSDEDQNHNCDTCGDTISQCADEDTDHLCDICGITLSFCDDTNHDHDCDYCGDTISQCSTKADPETGYADHTCDICGTDMGPCTDGNNNHKCDICGDTISDCTDGNNDHLCDICGVKISNCTDLNDDHKCDVCGDGISGSVDLNRDHLCDVCGEVISQCTNRNKDHLCDLCGTLLGDCADEDDDHKCDVCGDMLSQCVDGNNDHNCDTCGKPLSTCADEDKNHNCDTCGKTLSTCADLDNNHKCDVCDACISEKADLDRDHLCDICGEVISECTNHNKDHLCDLCGTLLGDCLDESKDHKCDVCGDVLSQCVDEDKDHCCDLCGKVLTPCADKDKNHSCDLCGKTLSECADEDKDHNCDICGKTLSECADEDKDHNCDLCGKTLSECADEDKDHNCDTCGKVLTECADEDKDHNCDLCGKTLSECADEDKDHKCDLCGKALSECADDDKDHNCDLCGKVLSECADEDKDHNCDLCGKTLSECADENKDHTCDLCGKALSECADEDKDHNCDLCGKALSECADEDKDHNCDLCGKVLSECADEDKDHNCDLCNKALSECADEDKDHKCDLCGKALSECADDDKDHNCDLCGKALSECADEDKDHNCDLCNKALSECADEDQNHTCDFCGKTTSECGDENTDHKCDTCGSKLGDVIRLYGANRFKTAFKVADELKLTLGVEKFESVIIANGTNFADALSGSYLASVKKAPMLLTLGDTMNAELHAYIEKNLVKGGTVYILGGTAAVPETLDVLMEGFQVVRLAGANRFETNLRILEEAGVSANQDVLVCTGTNFADALSASALNRPILLVGNSLTEAQKDFLEGKSGKFYILGGTNAVNATIENSLKAYGNVERLGGANRYETSVLIARKFIGNANEVVLAYGLNFPDGLSGGVLAYSLNAPLILTDSSRYQAASGYAAENSITCGYVLGGSGLVDDQAVRGIFDMTAEESILVK